MSEAYCLDEVEHGATIIGQRRKVGVMLVDTVAVVRGDGEGVEEEVGEEIIVSCKLNGICIPHVGSFILQHP